MRESATGNTRCTQPGRNPFFCAGLWFAITVCCTACQPDSDAKTAGSQPHEAATHTTLLTTAAPAPGTVHVRPESKPYLTIMPAASKPTGALVYAPGRVDFRQRAMSGVGAVIAGRVTKVFVQAGDKVTLGEPLLSLTSPDAGTARAKLRRAQVELTSAAELYKRQADMLQRGVGLELDRFKAGARLKEAQAELERAKEAASFLGEGEAESVVVRASIDGTVVHLKATVGAMVEPGETLLELGNSEALWVVADVFDRDLALVGTGARASVELASLPEPLSGRVAAVGAVLESESRRASVYIELDQQDKVLHPGMYARAAIQAPETERIVLPVEAVLIKDGKRNIVYVEKSAGEFEPREVVVGPSMHGQVAIIHGVNSGDRIVVSGALLLDAEAEQLL